MHCARFKSIKSIFVCYFWAFSDTEIRHARATRPTTVNHTKRNSWKIQVKRPQNSVCSTITCTLVFAGYYCREWMGHTEAITAQKFEHSFELSHRVFGSVSRLRLNYGQMIIIVVYFHDFRAGAKKKIGDSSVRCSVGTRKRWLQATW